MTQTPTTSRPLVVAAIMASMSMIAIEATIVATAMPQIAGDLGELRYYSWVFASFLLTQTAMTVVFGKLSDQYGRKPMVLFGIAIFLIGSILAGYAWSMVSMIVFRLIQGVGAGAVQPVVMTIIADLFPGRERGKVQGWLASVWAISAVLGPMVGALIIHKLSWAWIFWMNIPVGIAAAWGFIRYLHETPKRKESSIDFLGAALFTATVAAAMIALTDAGTTEHVRAWAAAGAFVVLLVLFVLQERRAADPMISFALWGRRPIAAVNGAMVFGSMCIMGLTTFLPMYVQGVMHRTPVVAGLALTMVMLGWPVGSTIAARLFPRYGLRRMLIIGSLLVPMGVFVFIFLQPDSSPLLAGFGSLVIGFGMGFMGVCSLVLVQEIVEPNERGAATGSNLFARNLGSTMGATLLGAVFNYGLAHTSGIAAVTSEQLKQVLENAAGAAAISGPVQQAMHQSLHITFYAMLVVSVLVVVVMLMIPPVPLAESRARAKAPADAASGAAH
ncbi:MDR family MFS transporter [Pigmentiphaga litoralis]|uniref:MDR family MFS transporter n=1 Tax=Pigmentiphaga litoralis TaxID=516702 RepID=UPI003B439E22